MKIEDFPFLDECILPEAFTLHRVQRLRARAGSVAIGALRLAPPGGLASRFDLVDQPLGYFAATPETALLETLMRRDATAVSMAVLAQRALLKFQTSRAITLVDLRPHTPRWPVLQSQRYASTQQLAAELRRAGHHGIAYRSVQQFGSDCFVLFSPVLDALTMRERQPLLNAQGGLHRAAVNALRGSQLPLVP